MATNGDPVPCAEGVLGQHRHVCAFFNGLDEQHRVLRSFIKEGFERGHKALHIVDPEWREDHLKRLGEAGIDVEQAMSGGQLELRDWQDAYLRGDRFYQDEMLATLEKALQSGTAAGYPLTRVAGFYKIWELLDKTGLDDFLEYETRLNYVLEKYDDPVICTYDLSKFNGSVVIDIMRTHPVVIIGGALHENPFFVPPDQFLLELRERRRSARVR